MRPFLWRFWTKTPAKGRMHLFDRSWYNRVLKDRMDGRVNKEQLMNAYNEIVSFEEQLSVDGTLIIKFFLHISKKEQKKRFEKLKHQKRPGGVSLLRTGSIINSMTNMWASMRI